MRLERLKTKRCRCEISDAQSDCEKSLDGRADAIGEAEDEEEEEC